MAIMHSLDDARLKVGRANEHLDDLERSIGCFLKDVPYTIRESDTKSFSQFFIEQTKDLPIQWGLIIGDAVTNLRASLDYIVWQFSRLDGPRPKRRPRRVRPAFPIYDGRADYRKGRLRVIGDIPVHLGAHTAIEQFQPYHRDKWPEVELLALLRDLANADKHRLLTPVFSEFSYRLKTPDALPLGRFNKSEEGVSLVLTERMQSRLGDDFKPTVSFNITMDVEQRHTNMILPVPIRSLHFIHDFIRDDVIPRFAGMSK